MPPPHREIPSFLLGLLAILALPIVLALYATLVFTAFSLARHAFHWMLT